MSDKLMDTEPGGERQNQYEGVHTFVEPHSKQAGQFGDPSTGTSTDTKTSDPGAPNTHGITPADKIRYGQSIQEGGMGGKTTIFKPKRHRYASQTHGAFVQRKQ
ncbi:hypothetical protein PtrEW13061_010114 [Pyrenophora tritici-repentis]|nr:hypothetical protein PtrEW13061_010114 [Pyrenophora tritici-repentis]